MGLQIGNKTNIKYSDEIKDYFSKFGKEQNPFGSTKDAHQKFSFVPKSRNYSLRNIPFTKLFEK